MDIEFSWYTNYEYILVCLQDNSCFGLETYYYTLPSLEIVYSIDPYAWYEEETLGFDVPNSEFWNDFGHYAGFSDRLFYTQAQTWKDLEKGILFYRFQNNFDEIERYEIGDSLTVWSASSVSPGNNRFNPGFQL